MKKKLLAGFITLLLASQACLTAGASGAATSKAPDMLIIKRAVDANNVNPKSVMPIVKKPTTLRMAMTVNAKVEDIETNKFTDFLRTNTGLDFKFDVLPSANASETLTKINLLFASKDMPDVITGYNFSRLNIIDYSEQGLIIPLNYFIDEYGYHTYKMYEEALDKDIESKLTMPDGNIYGFPGIVEQISNRCYIYQPWLDMLGLYMPTTTDEFYEVMKAFKEEDPNRNGKKDEIPLMGLLSNSNSNILTYFGNAFQYTDRSCLQVVDGKVQLTMYTPEMKETLMYLNKLCSEGLLDPVSFTQDQTQLRAVMAQDTQLVGAIIHQQKSSAIDVTSERGRDYVIMPPLKGSDGFVTTTETLGSVRISYVITSSCKNPAAAFRLGDYMLSSEATLAQRYGVEGVDWEYSKPGTVSTTGEPAKYNIINDLWSIPSSNIIWHTSNHPSFNNMANFIESVGDKKSYLNQIAESSINDYQPATQKTYESDITSLFDNADDIARYSELSTAINNYFRENYVKFIVGDKTFDAWDRYVSEFKKLNVDEYLALIQKGYDKAN